MFNVHDCIWLQQSIHSCVAILALVSITTRIVVLTAELLNNTHSYIILKAFLPGKKGHCG